MTTLIDERLNREHAEEICVFGGVEGRAESIFLLDESSEPAQVLDKYAARALAARLLALADQLPEPTGTLPQDWVSAAAPAAKLMTRANMLRVAKHLVRLEVVRSEMLDAGEGEVAQWWADLVNHILEEVPTEPGVAEAIAAYIVSDDDGA